MLSQADHPDWPKVRFWEVLMANQAIFHVDEILAGDTAKELLPNCSSTVFNNSLTFFARG